MPSRIKSKQNKHMSNIKEDQTRLAAYAPLTPLISAMNIKKRA